MSVRHEWPALPLEAWKDTYATLHMWSQIVGKITLALAPPVNHSWGIAFHLSARGLTTPVLKHDDRAFTMEFDFIEHRLIVKAIDGLTRKLPLEPKPVAAFYRDLMALMRDMALPVKIWPMPVEVPDPVRFDEDERHRSYDAEYANRFWKILVAAEHVFAECRSSFIGKCSPVHFFWGSFDLAVTRFSGRRAPARQGPAFERDAYSHEVISHGFWPGSGPVQQAAFYAYAVPPPDGLKDARIEPTAAYYETGFGEFILPYEAVRTAPSPENALARFVDSTYDAAATLAKWDRAALERAAQT